MRAKSDHSRRRGVASVWLILSAPLLMAALGIVLNMGFLWLARAELHNAAASGAMAGAQAMQENGASQGRAQRAARQFTALNDVTAACDTGNVRGPRAARVLLGQLQGTTFVPGRGGKQQGRRACLVDAVVQVEGPFGWLTGPRTLHARAAAVVDDKAGVCLAHVHGVKGE